MFRQKARIKRQEPTKRSKSAGSKNQERMKAQKDSNKLSATK
jgi:hypothetical protein